MRLAFAILVGCYAPVTLQSSPDGSNPDARNADAALPGFCDDTFEGSNGEDLDATGRWQRSTSSVGSAVIEGERAVHDQQDGSPARYACATDPPGSDYAVDVDVTFVTIDATFVAGVLARLNPAGDEYYEVDVAVGSGIGVVVDLIRFDGGAKTPLCGPTVPPMPPTPGSTHRLGLSVAGAVISARFDGQTLCAPTDPAPIGFTGRAGLELDGMMSPTTGFQLDNFSARKP